MWLIAFEVVLTNHTSYRGNAISNVEPAMWLLKTINMNKESKTVRQVVFLGAAQISGYTAEVGTVTAADLQQLGDYLADR